MKVIFFETALKLLHIIRPFILLDGLFSNFLQILFQKQLKISEFYAQEKKESARVENLCITKDPLFIELSRDL